jgi:hypothetical protein
MMIIKDTDGRLLFNSFMAHIRLSDGLFGWPGEVWLAGNKVDLIERAVDRFLMMRSRDYWATGAGLQRLESQQGKPMIKAALAWVDGGLLGESWLQINGYLMAEAGDDYVYYHEHQSSRFNNVENGAPRNDATFCFPLKDRKEMIRSLRAALNIPDWEKATINGVVKP